MALTSWVVQFVLIAYYHFSVTCKIDLERTLYRIMSKVGSNPQLPV